MASEIGYQNGINAVEQNLKALDPKHAAGYDKFADTQRVLVDGHNEVWKAGGLAAQLEDLRRQVQLGPFS